MSEISRLDEMLGARSTENCALWLEQEEFADTYRYMLRYLRRYREKAYKLLIKAELKTEGMEIGDSKSEQVSKRLGMIIHDELRSSDIMMQCGDREFFLFLPMVASQDINKITDRICSAWNNTAYYSDFELKWESEAVTPDLMLNEKARAHAPWLFVVDDDISNLKIAGRILSDNGMRVTALNSGQALLDKIAEGARPDLILLDVLMPGMDGFETLERLRKIEMVGEEIPVIFLTASEDGESERKGLTLGAMDFIRKPFVPDVLTLRVRHLIDLIKLQRDLSTEVAIKTSENEQLFLQVVQSLADAIDAKDTYTNGHSGRVAEYSREIAKRAGFNEKEQNDIYIMGLLHDVGKIGIPDEVINKPSRLTDEEFAVIKSHPVMGAKILQNISNMPKLSLGARWHHERYGGGGYPDGLESSDIPEEARIIAVADAYDAMTSHRSYRGVLSQSKVKSEIENGKGTQFDPRYADIMLGMMNEDISFSMREK